MEGDWQAFDGGFALRGQDPLDLPADRLLSAYVVWLQKQVMQMPGGQQVWEQIVAELDTPPQPAAGLRGEVPARPAALPVGAPVGSEQEAAALDAFMARR